MKIKRFLAPNMRTAMVHISETLGKDAVLLSSRDTENGVEVMAAIDYDESVFKHQDKAEISVEKTTTHPPPLRQRTTMSGSEKPHYSDPGLDDVQDRIRNLESLLQEHLSYQKWREIEVHAPVKAEVTRRLVEKGFDVNVVRRLIEAIPNETYFEIAWQEAQQILATELRIESDPIIQEPGVYALVGTTGVGKTTTVAKLAARAALRSSPAEVGLISTDVYRIAAKDQLSIYSKILNIPLSIVETTDNLLHALQRFKGKKTVIIDTAGFSQRDQRLIDQIAFIRQSPRPIKFYSVLSACTDNRVQEDVVQAFKSQGVDHAILSKVDESFLMGELLSLCIQKCLAVAYVCNGQRVPEDISQARSIELIRSACGTANKKQDERAIDKMTKAAGIKNGVQYV